MSRTLLFATLASLCGFLCSAGEPLFSQAPQAAKSGSNATFSFGVAKSTDVEVSVLNAKGGIVRHLAAGVLGGEKPPPEPLMVQPVPVSELPL